MPEEIPGFLDETSRSRLHGAFCRLSCYGCSSPRSDRRPLKCLETHRSIQREEQCQDAVDVSVSPRPRGTPLQMRPLSLGPLVLAPSVHVFRPSKADVTDDSFQVFELRPVHVPQLLHAWRREREAFAVEKPLTSAPLREEECFVLNAGKACISGVVVALRLPTTQRAPPWPTFGWETGEMTSVRQRARLTTRSETCLAVRHRARAALCQEWCHQDSQPQGPRKTLSDPKISGAGEDLLPVEHVPSDFSKTISCAHAFCTGNLRKEDTEDTESPGGAAGAINIVESRFADCRRPKVTPCVARRLAHLCCRQASRGKPSHKRDVGVLDLVVSLFV